MHYLLRYCELQRFAIAAMNVSVTLNHLLSGTRQLQIDYCRKFSNMKNKLYMMTIFIVLNWDCLSTILTGSTLIHRTSPVGGKTVRVRLLWSTTTWWQTLLSVFWVSTTPGPSLPQTVRQWPPLNQFWTTQATVSLATQNEYWRLLIAVYVMSFNWCLTSWKLVP